MTLDSQLAVAVVVVGLAVGVGLALHRRDREPLERALVALFPVALLVALGLTLVRMSAVPHRVFDAVRVAPAVALAQGHDLYHGPDEGPALDFMYGPGTAIAFLPAALASTPTGVLWLAGLLTVLFGIGPVAWLHFQRAGAPRGGAAAVGLAALLCFWLLAFRDLGLRNALFRVHADAPALGLGAATLALLVAGRGSGEAPRDRQLIPAALATALALWTKQTMAPLAVGVALYLVLAFGVRCALRYALWLAVAGFALLIAFAWRFGADDLFFNMFTLPARQPWYGEGGWYGGQVTGALPVLLDSTRTLLGQLVLPSAAIALLVAVGGTPEGGWRSWLRANPWVALLCVALPMAPLSIVGSVKVGGYFNVYAFTTYFLLAAATLCARGAALNGGARTRRAGQLVLLGSLLLLVVGSFTAPNAQALRQALARVGAPVESPLARAFAYAQRHEGEVFFPWNPLLTLLSEGRLYHSLPGVWDRDLAGYRPAPELLRAHLPPRAQLAAVVKRGGAPGTVPPLPDYFPAFEELNPGPAELSGWTLYRVRDPAR